MSKLNPCTPDCQRRCAGCRRNCPDWAAALKLREKARAAREKERLINGYTRDAARRNRRRRR